MHNIKDTKISHLPVGIDPSTKRMVSRRVANWANEADGSSLYTAVIK